MSFKLKKQLQQTRGGGVGVGGVGWGGGGVGGVGWGGGGGGGWGVGGGVGGLSVVNVIDTVSQSHPVTLIQCCGRNLQRYFER